MLLRVSQLLCFFVFAAVPVFFWKSDAPWSGFEWPKTTLFIGIVSLASLLLLFRKSSSKITKKVVQIFWVGIVLILASYATHLVLWGEYITEFLGTPPFYMSYLSFIGLLLLLFWMFRFPGDGRWIDWGIGLGAAWVISYTLLQYVWLDPIGYDTPFPDHRVFSTLGNPNSLAIYLLLIIPFIWEWFPFRYSVLGYGAMLWFIWLTGSWSILALAILWGTWLLLRRAGAPWHWYVACVLILFITAMQIMLWSGHIGEAKHLSLLTRFEIWWAWYTLAVHDPISLFFWVPENMVHAWLNEFRWVTLLTYVPADYRIDHFHSTWMDIYFQFWMLGGAFLILSVWKFILHSRPLRSNELRMFVGFFFVAAGCLHHLEITHWILLVAAFQWIGTSSIKHGFLSKSPI